MFNPIDSARLYLIKTLVSVTQQHIASSTAYPSGLKFQNGTTSQADILVGDDRTFDTMRSHVVGAAHPATPPVFMNLLSAVAHVDPTEAEKLFGQEVLEL
jgi:salicylate hydroxylase